MRAASAATRTRCPFATRRRRHARAAVRRPPRNDVEGVTIALGIIAAWAALFFHGCWQVRLSDAADGSARRSSWFDILATFLALEVRQSGAAQCGCNCMQHRGYCCPAEPAGI